MREFGHTDVDAKTRREDPKLAADDLDRWAFRKRFAAAHETSQLLWILLAIVGAFVVVLLVRIPSDHVSATSGSSEQSTLVREAPRRERVSASSSPTPERGPASSAIGTSSDMPMVYRCIGKGGAVSLQSQPCPADQRVSRAIYAPPEVERLRRPVVAPSVQEQAISYGIGPSAVDSERERRRTACANAKSNREETLARIGLSRTYDLLQRLDAMVYEACKGL